MFLRRIELKDWKSFVSARFIFPRPTSGRNVILLGARNGYGKTSLFEAIVLGLFGRRGLPLVARAPFGIGDEGLQTSYRNFLTDAFHRNALREQRTSASVELAFEDDDGEPLIVRRIWHFSSVDGRNKPQDEEVRIYEGIKERPVAAPPGEDAVEWRHAYLEKKFLPHYLAAFFLFDGEHVQILARQEMSEQVRRGIEGLLGIPVLRQLSEDLKSYADDRRYKSGGNVAEKALERIRGEIGTIEFRLKDVTERLERATEDLLQHTRRRDVLTRDLGALGTNGNETSVRERYDELNRVKRALEDLRSQLHSRVATGIALALTGRNLREQTDERLRHEAIREKWEAGVAQGEHGLDRFIEALRVSVTSMEPPLTEAQCADLIERVQRTWTSIWFPPPDGCAESYRHLYLRGMDREMVRKRLQELGRQSAELVGGILSQIAQRERDQATLETEIAQMEGIGPQLEIRMKELNDLLAQIDRLSVDRGRLEQESKGLTSELGQKRQQLALLVKTKDTAAPSLRRADRADRIAKLIAAVIGEAVPHQIKTVAEEMTRAYKAMSHKSLVERVVIEDDCSVKLLAGSGRNIREMAFSAGEQQIFAQALISAISRVSQRDFPIIVDTPLGRLDDMHRAGVLRHFTDREGQVFLLSTDTEVVGPYLDVVRPRLLTSYHLVHEHEGDVGRSKPVEGYFDGMKA